MKRVCQSVVLSVLIALGIVFAVHYGNVYTKDTEETVYLYFSIVSALEAIMTTSALIFFLKAKKGAWISTVYILSGILCIPILFCAAVWILHWIGLDLLPPSQQ